VEDRSIMRRVLIAIAALVTLIVPAAGQQAHTRMRGHELVVSGRPIVLDGATLLFHRGEAFEARVALAGIVVPPLQNYPYGPWAQLALKKAIGGRVVSCSRQGTDHTGRFRGHCQVEDNKTDPVPGLEDLSTWIVEQGLAVPEPGPRGDDKQAAAERAQAARRGIWSDFPSPAGGQ
jgi:endonuclease YncB( thermonuclease family)